ncbi:MAG: hypothetical protein SPJ46_00470, partial [Sodaliphilus sp.]|nr:hypothetical protein [Sodaliphilus sp.]
LFDGKLLELVKILIILLIWQFFAQKSFCLKIVQNMCQISPKIPTKLPHGEQICDSQRLKNGLND